jgi:chaperone modulatory protein CbpM
MAREKKPLDQACSEIGIEKTIVLEFIRREWVLIEHPFEREAEMRMDDEDLARIRLIQDLRADLGVNDESVPIILHLVDQLHALRRVLSRRKA